MTGIEIAAVGAFISALKNLKDLTASLGDKVPQQVHDQILDISERFSNIQLQLLAAQQQAIELTERCQELEGKLDGMNDWKTNRDRYALKQIGDGAYVFALRPEHIESGGTEARHWLCAQCFEDRNTSYLQGLPNGVWNCQRCKSLVYGSEHVRP